MNQNLPALLIYEAPDLLATLTAGDLMAALAAWSDLYATLMRRQRRDLDRYVRFAGLDERAVRIALALPAESGGDPITEATEHLASLVGAKRHLAGLDPALARTRTSSCCVVVLNRDNQPYELTIRQFQMLRSRLLDAELDTLTVPLAAGKIETVTICRGEQLVAKITPQERASFEYGWAMRTIGPEEIWIEGVLNSLTKTGYRGVFFTRSGERIKYSFVGSDPTPLLQAFAHRGNVRVRCTAKMNASATPVYLQITEVRPA